MKPCPFCKSHDVGQAQHRRDCWTVLCFNCEAEGPPATTQTEAIKKWQARAETEEKAGA